MTSVRSLCVFCGSRDGALPSFTEAAAAFGAAVARRRLTLVYGGASVGLMGTLADAALAAGGEVHGVITEALSDHEIAHPGLQRLDVVQTMHERKARMAEHSDAVLMLPGGFGTLEEFTEVVTWVQLGILDKPYGILNVEGFYDGFLGFLEHATDMGFIRPRQLEGLHVSDQVDELLDMLTGGVTG